MAADLTDAERAQLHRDLQELRDTLVAAAAGADERSGTVELDGSMGRLSRMDALQQQEMAAAQARLARARLASVRRALARIADGTYGECPDCGEPIGVGRLRARPDTPFCVGCAARRGQ